MKIKQVESLLKAKKSIIVFDANGCQWVGDGGAFYPLYNMPKLTQENFFAMFDIPVENRDKFYFSESDCPTRINFSDTDDTEEVLERSSFELCMNGARVEPLLTNHGIAFINTKYLKPFKGLKAGYELYERSIGENVYIAVKSGFMLLGIIAPMSNLVNEQFVESLGMVYKLSERALKEME